MIGELVQRLVAAGTDPALAAEIVAEAFAAGVAVCGNSADKADISADRRRAKDRLRKRNVRGIPQISADSADTPLKEESKIKNSKRTGERLSADWKLDQPEANFALSKGLTQARIDTETEKFRNYWTAKSGAAAAKLDWPATWRNWVLTALERTPGLPPSTAPPNGAAPAYLTPPPGQQSLEEIRKQFGANKPQIRDA